jgi:UDP-sulfoquinovose synthase
MELAKKVQSIGKKKGLAVEIINKENPRMEAEKHYYNADHSTLQKLGFKRTREIDDEIDTMLEDLLAYKDRIEEKKSVIIKNIQWRKTQV